jgi:hypothetical protein
MSTSSMRADIIRRIIRAYDDLIVRAYRWVVLIPGRRFLDEMVSIFRVGARALTSLRSASFLALLRRDGARPLRPGDRREHAAHRDARAGRRRGSPIERTSPTRKVDARTLDDGEVAGRVHARHRAPHSARHRSPLLRRLHACLGRGGILIVKDVDTRPAPSAGSPDARQADGAGRHSVRYWSGTSWGAARARRGIRGTASCHARLPPVSARHLHRDPAFNQRRALTTFPAASRALRSGAGGPAPANPNRSTTPRQARLRTP